MVAASHAAALVAGVVLVKSVVNVFPSDALISFENDKNKVGNISNEEKEINEGDSGNGNSSIVMTKESLPLHYHLMSASCSVSWKDRLTELSRRVYALAAIRNRSIVIVCDNAPVRVRIHTLPRCMSIQSSQHVYLMYD
jgi:hypothetical protein